MQNDFKALPTFNETAGKVTLKAPSISNLAYASHNHDPQFYCCSHEKNEY